MTNTTPKLRKLTADDLNDYEATRTDHNGRPLPTYEVTLDGVRLGRIYQVETGHDRLSGRIRVGRTYEKCWMADTRPNDRLRPGKYSNDAGKPEQVRSPYFPRSSFSTRAEAIEAIVEATR